MSALFLAKGKTTLLFTIIFYNVHLADVTSNIAAPNVFTIASIVCFCMYDLCVTSTAAHGIAFIAEFVSTFPTKLKRLVFRVAFCFAIVAPNDYFNNNSVILV